MQRQDQLTIERSSRTSTAEKSISPAATKSVLFHVHDDDALAARLQAALAISRACSAHLDLIEVIPVDLYTATDSYGGAFVSGEIVEALEEQADKLRARIESHLKKEDVSWNYDCITSLLVPELLQRAALADLVVMGREPHWHEFNRTGPGLLGEIICSMRTPLCIPGDGRETFDPFGNAVIAWNGSFEAANAIRSNIGLLKMAAQVRLVCFTEYSDKLLPDMRVTEYLSRHDIRAEIETQVATSDIATGLVEYAKRLGAEYVVMGGYSHSRAGEFLFGGVTRELLGSCELSLLLAH